MRSRNTLLAVGAALMTVASASSSVLAQTSRDSALYLKAQQMVSNGNAASGRSLVDSVLKAAPVGSVAYAEGLYWRATLAPSARDAENDYRHIVVDYPLSARVPDALLRMGELESARGDREAALQHFQRLVREHPESPLHPEASYWLARTYLDSNDLTRGCTANADALALVQPSNVELKNRIDFQQQRCRGFTVAQAAAPPMPQQTSSMTPAVSEHTVSEATKTTVETTAKASTKATRAAAPPARSSSLPRASKPAAARSSSATSYSVQVAAFSSRTQADRLAAMLRRKGYASHVDGSRAPYRVRIGSYSTYGAAAAELKKLKAKQIDGFVAER